MEAQEQELWKNEGPKIPSFREQERAMENRQFAEIADQCYSIVRARAGEVGMEVSDLPSEKVRWSAERRSAHGWYSHEHNDVNFKENQPVSIRMIMHEELHYASSEQNNGSDETIAPKKREGKSGFASAWDETGEHTNFKGLNEAMTEKIARELFAAEKDRFDEEYTAAHGATVEERRLLLAASEKQEFSDWEKNAKEMYDLLINPEETFEEHDESQKNEIRKRYEHGASLPFNPSYLEDSRIDYQEEVELLEKMLDGLGKARAEKDGIAIEEARQLEWRELQKAYFSGNVQALRRIDTVLGQGTLRNFEEIDRRKITSMKDRGEFQKNVEKLKSEIEGIIKGE